MAQTHSTVHTGQNFARVDMGAFADLTQHVFTMPNSSFQVAGKAFLHNRLGLTSAEISLNYLPPKKSIPFYHKHRQNEEIYIFLQGQGEFQVDGQFFGVTQGSVVRVDPAGERCIRNVSDTDELCFIVIQARAGSYPDHTVQDGVSVERRVSWIQPKESGSAASETPGLDVPEGFA
jgi:mannose-6-phosphate isomerase-like protein (cupin superfamily)